eukprot:5173544-Amphidinium_carterae.1
MSFSARPSSPVTKMQVSEADRATTIEVMAIASTPMSFGGKLNAALENRIALLDGARISHLIILFGYTYTIFQKPNLHGKLLTESRTHLAMKDASDGGAQESYDCHVDEQIGPWSIKGKLGMLGTGQDEKGSTREDLPQCPKCKFS